MKLALRPIRFIAGFAAPFSPRPEPLLPAPTRRGEWGRRCRTSLACVVPPAAAADASPTAAAVPAVARGLALPTMHCPQAAAADEPFDSDPAAVLPCVRAFPSSFLKPFYPVAAWARGMVFSAIGHQLVLIWELGPTINHQSLVTNN